MYVNQKLKVFGNFQVEILILFDSVKSFENLLCIWSHFGHKADIMIFKWLEILGFPPHF